VAGAKALVAAVKFLLVMFALLTVTEVLEGVKVYPVKLGSRNTSARKGNIAGMNC